ncbi:MAG: hypothetical protein DI570_18875 [Phenylobacterium zucineum]|nr:MAG: hypothetical protein DI570_18875 [Phenylobacterium zucineum]
MFRMDRRYQDPLEGFRQQRPLAEYPSETVTLACSICSRRGRYSRAKLIADHGPTFGLVNLLNYIAQDCVNGRRDPWGNSSCRAYYVELDPGRANAEGT